QWSSVMVQVLPEDWVVDVSAEVEGEIAGQLRNIREFAALTGFVQLFGRSVRALDVGGVVLVVVQLHDASRDVRLESGVVVGQFRKGVLLSHEIPPDQI